jgi:hypothetical protein
MTHPFFAKEVPPPDKMTAEWEALIALKYDEDEPFGEYALHWLLCAYKTIL